MVSLPPEGRPIHTGDDLTEGGITHRIQELDRLEGRGAVFVSKANRRRKRK